MRLRTGAKWQSPHFVCFIITCLLPPISRAQDEFALFSVSEENDIRLVDGPNPYEGRVEIFQDGVWLSGCGSYVSSNFGRVVCRQLGYPADGAVLYYANSYGSAPGEILRKYISCNGQEASLSSCSISPRDQNCDPQYTLGVSCDTGLSEVQTVRLVNGTSQYEGRVEVFKAGVWGSVTDRSYSERPLYNAIAANIVCGTLFGSGYGGSVVPKQEAILRFGVARRMPIQISSVRCEGNEQSLFTCSYYTPGTYETLEDNLAVVCKQVPEGCNWYSAEPSGTINSPGFPEGAVYSSDTDCVWTIVNKAGKIQLSFTNLQINTTLTASMNILRVLDSNAYSYLANIQRPTTVGTLESSGNTLYVWLKAQSGTKGIQFQASWDVPPCFQRLTSTGSYIQSPGYPNQYQPYLNCTYEIVKRKGVLISFSFYTFALGEQQGGVCQDVLQIFDGDSETSPTVGGPLCGTTRPPVTRTSNVTSTLVLVRFMSDAINTSVETGFSIYYSQVEPDPVRPGNYTTDVGSFKSPGYSNVYNDEEDVIWTIITKPYKAITLSFQDVQLGTSYLDLIRVFDRSFGGTTSIYNSGSVSPIISNGNSLEVRLYSTLDNGVNRFKASWTTDCRQIFQTANGVITSPNDQEFNTSSADCTYIIRQQAGYYIRIQFSSINFEKDATCRNYVEIRDGSTEFFPVLGEKYCGLSLPPPLTSTQNVVFMKFNTQIGNNYFNLTYSSHPKECDKGLMTDSEGSFTSPGFPLGYSSNTYCVWTIKVDDKKAVIDLTFDDFAVGYQGTQCQYAFVRIYDGVIVDASTVITTLCGTALPPKLRSTGSSLTVVLNVFGSLVNANGFRATYIARRSSGGLPKGLYPYGVAANDGILESSILTIPFLEDQFPFGLIPQSTVNVGRNGIVSFEKGTAWPWLDYSRRVVCVYCTYISDEQSVYYHLYGIKDWEVVTKATFDVQEFTGSKSFQASVVFVITWDRVKQYFPSVDYKPTNMGDATFQVALVTDWSESYALVQYRLGHMTWRYPGRWYSIQMGVAKGSLTTYRPNVYSGTELAYEIDTYFGNTGYKGYWVYELGKVPASYHKTCQDWFRRNKELKDQRKAGFAALPRCPCSRRGIFSVVNQWRFHRRDEENYFECYILNLARTGQFAPFGKECCYSTNPLKPDTLDMLITSPPFAGAALAFNPLVFAQEKLYDSEDRMPHVACCEHGTNKQCRRYYNLRPIGKCDPNPAIQWTPLYGDPHITTMDGREYLFNGLGEFTLVSLNTSNVSFTLQARTQRAELRPGTPTNGTVFTAVGAEENGVRVFLQIDPNTNTTLVVYAKDVDYTRRFVEEGDDFTVDDESLMLQRDNETCVVSFPSGISLQIYIRMKALVIGIAMPRNFQNVTKGLLGNFNEDRTDDFILPSGESLNNSLSERQIFNLFANKWLVSANNSVIRYEARMGPADFCRQDFKPVFLDEVDPSQLTEAKVLCGDTNMPCIYDFLATGDRSFAFQTSDLRTLSDILIQQSKNTAPLTQVPEVAYIIVGVPRVIIITGVDPDVNDALTYHLVDDQNETLSINKSSGAVNVSLTSLKPIKILVYVVDSQGAQSPVESVPIVACSGCSGHGTCNMSDTRDVLGDHDFQYAVCQCGPAWAGDNCELDGDGCSDSPCHPLRTCTDIPAAQQGSSDIGYVCSACPQGYFMKNDSSDCYDVDECLNSTLHGCDMLCINTYGSYECSCQEGFRLSTNGHSCDDVNECVERTHDCQQICNNTVGGFQCECEAGYTYDSTSKSCIMNAIVSQICGNSACSQGCRVMTDAANNSRPQCFCYQGFDLDVRDNETCVDRDECRDKVCDQVCNNTAGGFSCSCYDGFALNKDERTCSACPYLKYGPECRQTCTCSGRSVACHPVRGCFCQDGWTGTTCADDVDECAENPDVCGLDQICVNNRGSYSCDCRSGYELHENGVCQDIDECTTDAPCEENEKCTNIPGGYYCTCKQGYSKADSTNCTDINECALNRGDCQHDCVNVPGSFNCECKYGYRLTADRKTCSQVRDVCPNLTMCSKAHGCTLNDSNNNEMCFCNSGYMINQNMHTCEDIDECTTTLASCSHNCSNTQGSFVCSCPDGMKLDNNELTCLTCSPGTFGPSCTYMCTCAAGADRCDPVSGCVCRQGWEGDKCNKDVDECQSGMSPANCTGENVECVNTYGGYTCRCRQGFAADNNSVCRDIDECSEPVCDQHCNNTIGSFHCTCDDGFDWDAVTQTCKDLDECKSLETNACTQHCVNTAGSYRCSCNVTGYILNNDGFTCRALIVCQRTDCDDVNGGCVVEADGETCFCNSGYYLLSDGVTCSRTLENNISSTQPSSMTPDYTVLSTDTMNSTSPDYTVLQSTDIMNSTSPDYTVLSTNIVNGTSPDYTVLSTNIVNGTSPDYTVLSTDTMNSTSPDYTVLSTNVMDSMSPDYTDMSNSTTTTGPLTWQAVAIIGGTVGGVVAGIAALVLVVLKMKAHALCGVKPIS